MPGGTLVKIDLAALGWEPWTSPPVEELLPQLSHEEQRRVHGYLREHQRVLEEFRRSLNSERERDSVIMQHVRPALHHYNAKHPGEEFDAVKPVMESSVFFRGQMWYHVNFWARCRKTRKINRFFAEVHYKPKPLSPVPGAEKPSSWSSSNLLDFIPVVEACTIIEEPLGRYWKSCAFCRGHLDILHPKGGRKFVCGNDKDRVLQRIKPCGSIVGLNMPFTCHLGPDSISGHDED